jgi:hypothetical protein
LQIGKRWGRSLASGRCLVDGPERTNQLPPANRPQRPIEVKRRDRSLRFGPVRPARTPTHWCVVIEPRPSEDVPTSISSKSAPASHGPSGSQKPGAEAHSGTMTGTNTNSTAFRASCSYRCARPLVTIGLNCVGAARLDQIAAAFGVPHHLLLGQRQARSKTTGSQKPSIVRRGVQPEAVTRILVHHDFAIRSACCGKSREKLEVFPNGSVPKVMKNRVNLVPDCRNASGKYENLSGKTGTNRRRRRCCDALRHDHFRLRRIPRCAGAIFFKRSRLVALPVHAAWARFLVVTDRRSGLARAAKKWPRLRGHSL